MNEGAFSESVGDDLVAEARHESQAAMLEVYARHRGLAIGHALRMTGDRNTSRG
jgi:hypothetical protein